MTVITNRLRRLNGLNVSERLPPLGHEHRPQAHDDNRHAQTEQNVPQKAKNLSHVTSLTGRTSRVAPTDQDSVAPSNGLR